eukprot:180644-Alexandrium_andersonii.AAC.1
MRAWGLNFECVRAFHLFALSWGLTWFQRGRRAGRRTRRKACVLDRPSPFRRPAGASQSLLGAGNSDSARRPPLAQSLQRGRSHLGIVAPTALAALVGCSEQRRGCL